MKVSSPTGAMAAIYESRQMTGNYLAAIPTADEQLGAAYASEIPSSASNCLMPTPLIEMWQLSSLRATRSMRWNKAERQHPPDLAIVQAFVEVVRSAQRQRFSVVGTGETVRLSGNVIVGAALEVEDSSARPSVGVPPAGWRQ